MSTTSTRQRSHHHGVECQPQVMTQLADLARLQRACLTLCVLGGHTHRDAADLLGIPTRVVAGLVVSGLRDLSRSSFHVSAVSVPPT